MSSNRFMTAIFPSAGSVHIWYAESKGLFKQRGVDVEVFSVTSSDQQMQMWDSGQISVMHTSPDHLLRRRERAPVAVRPEGIGELSVFVRSGVPHDKIRWGVDGAQSAFALVLRAVVEDAGIVINPALLHEIGGTRQRFEALLDDRIDGAVLHAPFDFMAAVKGFEKLGSHLTTLPDLVTVVVVVPGSDLGSSQVQSYLAALDDARNELSARGSADIADILCSKGWKADAATAAAEQMLAPGGGFAQSTASLSDGLRATVRLRQKYFPKWAPDRTVDEIVFPM